MYAWQGYVDLAHVSTIVLPSPMDILRASWQRYDLLLRETWPTTLESVYGFALAVIIGVPMAVCVANSRILNLSLYPILIATQSVPKVAVAPIILVWFGLGMQSKLAIAFLVAFFPIVVDTATGLQATPSGLMELARSLRASRWQTFWKVQFPAALPFIFSGREGGCNLGGDRRGDRRVRRFDQRARQSVIVGEFATGRPARLGRARMAQRARDVVVLSGRARGADSHALGRCRTSALRRRLDRTSHVLFPF